MKKLPLVYQVVTETYLKSTYLSTYATVVTVVLVVTAVTVVNQVTVVTVQTKNNFFQQATFFIKFFFQPKTFFTKKLPQFFSSLIKFFSFKKKCDKSQKLKI